MSFVPVIGGYRQAAQTPSSTLFYYIEGNGSREALAIVILANKADIPKKNILIASS